ncbi:fj [Drosophila busckii]|uniref:Fj n=1 Tax=Drosophila busckii TaxID=30019 RepID=A0A0M5J0C4_DROBS|nr:fj [Drosophila busckii]
MYDIKRLEAEQHLRIQNERLSGAAATSSSTQLSCSVITPSATPTLHCSPIEATHMTLLTLRRRRAFQRRACLLSILAAFVFGMALGVIVPMLGLPDYFASSSAESRLNLSEQLMDSSSSPLPYSVAFVNAPQLELSAEQVFRNVFHLEQDKQAPDSMLVKKLDTSDGSIKEFHVQRIANGRFRKGPERRLSKSKATVQASSQQQQQQLPGIIAEHIYWGELVERALPAGFAAQQQRSWQRYVAQEGQVLRLESGCGRMQNRLVVFADGTRACARYRQNTDQIQGEIFSYYLGQLLNISNLAPSAATIIDTTQSSWSAALTDITQAQWKEQRPVVLTRWLTDLEPAGIPQPFQPLERHLNKQDVWNITRQLLPASAQTAAHPSSTLEQSTSQSS